MSVNWRGVTLDERTAAMMDEVAALSGDVYVRPTQGSYAGGGVQASAGTHDGCGAIDIAGQDEGMTQADREVIATAGRQVGFAMWIRSPDQSDWPWHIHGIAVQPDGQWDAGGLSDGGHGQVIDYYEGRNGLASGAPDDGPRDWVGVTWETYGAKTAAAPPPPKEDTVAACIDQNGATLLFAIGADGKIAQQIYDGTTWSDWLFGIPGTWAKSLSATCNQDGQVSIFGVGDDGQVYQTWSSAAGWQGPIAFPGVISV